MFCLTEQLKIHNKKKKTPPQQSFSFSRVYLNLTNLIENCEKKSDFVLDVVILFEIC